MNRNSVVEIFSFHFLHLSRTSTLILAGISIALIALIDWRFEANVSFGFLYLFPMLLVGGCLTRLQIAGVAALCTGLTEAFDPFPWTMQVVDSSRLILTFAAFFGMSLYSFQSARSRRLANQHLAEIEKEVQLRRRTEEQLEFLISNSPATIFTLDVSGKILLANEAAHRLLRVDLGKLQGQSIDQFLPALANAPPLTKDARAFHTEMECRGRRRDGEAFMAHIWFSTYHTMDGPRLAAVVFDASEELRDRAEFSLQQILTGSKVLVGALCHEIRNLCGAIAAVHAKLARDRKVGVSEDFNALGALVQGLEKMAGLELRQTTKSAAESINLRSVLEELRIVIEPSFDQSSMSIHWDVSDSLPRVWADRQALLQAFLNIVKNSHRAMERQELKELTVRTSVERDSVAVRFIDSGPGVSNPERLFELFQPGAQASGLGLYLSRTFVRAFQGDIRYEPQPGGCCFVVSLVTASLHQLEVAARL